MNILLAYPQFPADTFWSFERALSLSGRSATMPPLGLLTIAGAFPTERFSLSLADENVRPIEDDELRAADVVLASAMIAQKESLGDLVARCERLGVPVIIGGPLVSACYADLWNEGLRPRAWFIGEAEVVLSRLIEDLESGSLRAAYAHVTKEEEAQRVRLSFGDDAHVHIGERPSLDDAPMPRFDLVELDAYHSMVIQASRGCPIGCEFCDIWRQLGLKSRTSSPGRLVHQLGYLFTLGWRGRVFIVDDNFIGNVGAVQKLLPALSDWQRSDKAFVLPEAHLKAIGIRRTRKLTRRWRRDRSRQYPFALSTEADVRVGSDAPKMTEIREQMTAAGFNSLFLGIETPSADALREAGKQVNIGKQETAAQHLLDCVARIQGAGMEVMSGFIVGFDNDSETVDQELIEFIERAAIPVAMVGLLAVVPGTALEERLTAEGRLLSHSKGDQTHGFSLGFKPVGRSERVVVGQYARVLEALYGGDMSSYYARCEGALAALPAPPRTGDRIGWRELRALVASLAVIRPRRRYLAFLARTLLKRPRFLGLAVVLALQGSHLHELTVRRLAEYRRERTPSTASSTRVARPTSSAGLVVQDAVAS